MGGGYPFRYYAERGGLMSCGNDQADNYWRAAAYVDRVLKGDKPGELPVQAPVKFELTINLKSAKALGLGSSHIFCNKQTRCSNEASRVFRRHCHYAGLQPVRLGAGQNQKGWLSLGGLARHK
jgi:ABC-type uncharacterized transport system substrate-binding protein